MIRHRGQVMTDIRFRELQVEGKELSLMQRLNNYFFGEAEIHLRDFLLFYGLVPVMFIALIAVCIPAWISM